MKLVAARCPNCGANIDVDVNSDSAKCKFCDSTIIVNDAINKLRIELVGNVEVNNLPSLEDYLKNGERYYLNNEWNEAYKQYNKAIELDPDNYLVVLRNGICNALDEKYDDLDLNPLKNGIIEAKKLLKKDASDECYNQIAREGYKAANIIDKFATNIYKKSFYSKIDLMYNRDMLFNCLYIYEDLEDIPKDNEIKNKILDSKIKLIDNLIASKKYGTGFYKAGKEIKELYIPPKSELKRLYNMRSDSVKKYNMLVPSKMKKRIKKQPLIRLDSKLGQSLIVIILTIIIIIISYLFF